MSDTELKLGDRVKFTGTVRKTTEERWRGIVAYADAPLPGFTGYRWTEGNEVTQHPVSEGVVVGKRRYRTMFEEEGLWIADEDSGFTGYLVAWNLSRKPVIVRLDQIVPDTIPEGGTHE